MRVSLAKIRVRYPETDRMGVAHHTHFFVWFEVGRTECMRELGCPYSQLEESGIYFPVVEAAARYHRPALYDEELTVETRIEEVRGVTVRFAYKIMRSGDGEPLASGFTVHASVNGKGEPRRIPGQLRERLLPGRASS